MFDKLTTEQFKKVSARAKKIASPMGVNLPLSKWQELLSKSFGFGSFHEALMNFKPNDPTAWAPAEYLRSQHRDGFEKPGAVPMCDLRLKDRRIFRAKPQAFNIVLNYVKNGPVRESYGFFSGFT